MREARRGTYRGHGVLPAESLSITRIPRIGLLELQAAIADAIYWQQHFAVTRRERIERDAALVRLMQCRWHVDSALEVQDQAA